MFGFLVVGEEISVYSHTPDNKTEEYWPDV